MPRCSPTSTITVFSIAHGDSQSKRTGIPIQPKWKLVELLCGLHDLSINSPARTRYTDTNEPIESMKVGVELARNVVTIHWKVEFLALRVNNGSVKRQMEVIEKVREFVLNLHEIW